MTPALFDSPGPRARRRIRIATVVAVLAGLVLVALAVRQFAINGELAAARWAPYASWPMWRYLLGGLGGTALAAVLGVALAMLAGLALAFARVSRHLAVRAPARVYVEAIRVVPLLLLIYFAMFALPRYGMDLPLLWKLVLPIAVSRSAQFAEIFRSGFRSLEAGQGDAAAALGMRPHQAMRYVIFPQAIRRVVPALISQAAGVVKDTSLGIVVSYAELLESGKVLAGYNRLLIQTYLVIALLYFAINYALSRLARAIDARQRPAGPGPLSPPSPVRRGRGRSRSAAATSDAAPRPDRVKA
ncbi:amino acid ABC transporter permease [Amycolatopsis granulosa]|uniref:amino acid ABC transporter permease n=1 Tax=Amycolatopsis granulosa TaxID=185684 RepID=UPI00141E6946|nr:amino acid ABC transporter permease [Amycolatopsis granulosa]NIH86919.1 glutamate transport system permease protein [Amycolatopsis granulosa]